MEIRPVWLNEAGGWAVALSRESDAAPELFAKWNPAGSGESLADELERLTWLQGRHPVPEPIRYDADADHELLVTRALPGESAISERWKREPNRALRALGDGLRRLHSLPVEECPFEWSVASRLGGVDSVAAGLGEMPSVDRLVVCQGDACAPNTLLDSNGHFLAHVDVARLGAADRWADLALVTMSLAWNFEGYDESVFWEAYGVAPDPERIDYYRRLHVREGEV